MKRLIATLLVLAVLGVGLWWSLRRQPSAAPLDDQGAAFTLQAAGPGRMATFQDTQTPLREFHWLPPLPGGILAAQVLSQNDRQRVALIHDGLTQELLLVLKPVGVSDGFWRFALLREAAIAPGGALLLLYQAGDSDSTELPLTLALDVASQQVKWFCRGAFSHMAVTPGGEAVYLYGGKNPVQRVVLDQAAGTQHPLPAAIELPAEIPAVDGLLPTGPATFLVSHANGLSAYRPKEGWTHVPAPADPGVACQDWHPSVTRNRGELWWQAVPGKLVKVRPDGRTGAEWSVRLPPADPFAQDASLLRLLGADPSGCLWFSLANPAPAAAPAAVPPPAAAAAAVPPPAAPVPAPAGEEKAAAPADSGPDWTGYAAAGLDRFYRWNPGKKTLERVSMRQGWTALNPPSAVQRPAAGQGVVPAAGALLAEGGRCAWWLPLEALPLEQVALQAM